MRGEHETETRLVADDPEGSRLDPLHVRKMIRGGGGVGRRVTGVASPGNPPLLFSHPYIHEDLFKKDDR